MTQAPLHLDAANKIDMRPDLLWYYTGVAQAVVDAKYKAERADGFPNADLYQMLAYCTVLGLPEGHLVYAKGNEPVNRHTVRRSDLVIHCHALDLASPPVKLLQQIDQLAQRITGLSVAQ